MNFTPQQLLPTRPGFIPEKSVTDRIPHTPFWNPPEEHIDSVFHKTLGFHGDDFFFQNKTTIEYEQDLPDNPDEGRFVSDDPICGVDAYSFSTSVDYDEGTGDPYNGTLEKIYVFDETLNEVRLETVETGNHFGAAFSNTRTATTQIFGNQYADPSNHVIETFSTPVDKTTLDDYLDEWRSKPEEFRDITGNGLGTYAYIGQGATKSESDGYLAEVGGGDVRALPYTFTEFSASGMTGDIAALWNGNFTAKIYTVTRKNAPVIHREQCEDYSYHRNIDSGTDIYRAGYIEEELSEPLTSWRDDYGVFETGEELDAAPLVPVRGGDIEYLATSPVGGGGNDVFLVSRDGGQYRVSLEYGDYTPDWEGISTEVVVTGETTLQSPAVSIELPSGAYYARVAKIERKVGADWVVVSDIANGDTPETLISTSVRQAGALLFAVSRRRIGERWGFYPFSGGGETRYRVQTYKLHLTPGTVTLSSGACGGDVTGNLDMEWEEEFDVISGVAKPREVTQWEAAINGTDWTPAEPYYAGYFGSIVTETATLRRREDTAELNGRFLVAFDEPYPNGKIISTATVSAAVSFTGGINVGDEVPLLPPASGHSVFFEGFRLRL